MHTSCMFLDLKFDNLHSIHFAGFTVKGRNSNCRDEGTTTGVRLC